MAGKSPIILFGLGPVHIVSTGGGRAEVWMEAERRGVYDEGGFSMIAEAGKGHTLQTALFGGGCFWCMQPPFEEQEGVVEVVVGYGGGTIDSPDYRQVAAGRTDHLEAVKVTYDPEKVDYRDLIDIFWRQIDPTDDGGQFADRGNHYRTAIFYTSEEQKRIAETAKRQLERSNRFEHPIVTRILPATTFYPAEEYHQRYYQKNSAHYSMYKKGSGREPFIEKVWKNSGAVSSAGNFQKPSPEQLRQQLTPLQYEVTQQEGTEPPFTGDYWDNGAEGIYVDVVSGEALFSSRDKFDSGTGWPSFTRPLVEDNIVEKVDRKLFSERTEVRSRLGDSHLGHVFADGPEPTGLRYCINSAALRFIPRQEMEGQGYGEFLRKLKNEP